VRKLRRDRDAHRRARCAPPGEAAHECPGTGYRPEPPWPARIDRPVARAQGVAAVGSGDRKKTSRWRCCARWRTSRMTSSVAASMTSRQRKLLYETSLGPEPEYTFKHALTYEVAYASLLQARRRALHSRIVQAIEQRSANRLTEHVERLAHHAYRGQVWDKAVTYLRQAGAKAQERSAHREALTFLDEALEALRHLSEDVRRAGARDRCTARAPRARCNPLGEFREDAGRTCEKPRPWPARSRMHAGSDWWSVHIGEYFRQTGQFAEARRLAQQALILGDKLQDVPLQPLRQTLSWPGVSRPRRLSARFGAAASRRAVSAGRSRHGGRIPGTRTRRSTSPGSRAASPSSGSSRRGVGAGPPGRLPSQKESTAPIAWPPPASGSDTSPLVRGDVDGAVPVLERACKRRPRCETSHCSVRRPPDSWAGAYLLAGPARRGCGTRQGGRG